MVKNITLWREFSKAPDPINYKLPDDWEFRLDFFEKMCVLKCIRPEKLMYAFAKYVMSNLGKYYLESPSLTMEKIYKDSDYKTPIIYVLSQGADPISAILKYAREINIEKNL